MGSSSIGGTSKKSTSPASSALAAVCASGMMSQITRSSITRLPPEMPEAASLRGT